MKVLGVIFDAHLKWESHVTGAIKKCTSKLSVLRKLRPKFMRENFLQIITSQFYSQLYSCCSIWLSSETRWNLKRIIDSALRIAMNDFKKQILFYSILFTTWIKQICNSFNCHENSKKWWTEIHEWNFKWDAIPHKA